MIAHLSRQSASQPDHWALFLGAMVWLFPLNFLERRHKGGMFLVYTGSRQWEHVALVFTITCVWQMCWCNVLHRTYTSTDDDVDMRVSSPHDLQLQDEFAEGEYMVSQYLVHILLYNICVTCSK